MAEQKNPNALFVTRDVEVLEGEAAAAELQLHNDARFYADGRGVARVDSERWTEAQHYERTVWMRRQRAAADDRNRAHMMRFGGYRALAGLSFDRAIELGCGPFTNLRLILGTTHAREIHLLDPLIRDYVAHPLCRYRGGRFGGVLGFANAGATLSLMRNPVACGRELLDAYRIGRLRGRPIQIEPSTIEDFETSKRFDLVILVNVIEHCRDAHRVFQKVREILAPGGVLVFHDKFFRSEDLLGSLATIYDAGHPLRLDPSVAEGFLKSFRPIMRADYWDEENIGGATYVRRAVYFIGRHRE